VVRAGSRRTKVHATGMEIAVACTREHALRVLYGPEYSQVPHTSRVRYPPLRFHYTCTSCVLTFGMRLLIPVACILMGALPLSVPL
jgi:hypothetical protein